MSDEYAVGSLSIRQITLTEEYPGNRVHDLAIAGLSWESRGTLCFSRLSGPSPSISLLKFASRSPETEAAKATQLANFNKMFNQVLVKELSASTDASANFINIKRWLEDEYNKVGRPLRLLCDISCIPKTYILFILGLGFTEELIGSIDCLYAPGLYDLTMAPETIAGTVSGPRALLSDGEWHSRQIPYLEAADYVAPDKDLVVTLGGELGLSLPFIARHEPQRLSLVFIAESAPGGSSPMLDSERSAYEELRSEPNAARTDLGLCDAIGVAKHAFEFASASIARGVTGIAIGSKPHALGLGLAALAHPSMEVVCRVPTAYKLMDVAAAGTVHVYEIRDRFDPASYL